MTTVTRALNSIGKKCFIDYYDQFKNCNDKLKLANFLLNSNSSATSLLAQITRVNYAQWIFNNEKEKEALEIIINSSRVDRNTIAKAKMFYSKLK